ncbi:MAG TPA: hypothetical protein VLT84_05765 [Acidobacteriota bacterium]|nr:hypothetical protein [Acidobacteriota bacterium]
MTRAAHRILDRARTSAWRRVGIPEVWPDSAARRTEPTGQKVTDAEPKDQETTRSEEPAQDVTPGQDEK